VRTTLQTADVVHIGKLTEISTVSEYVIRDVTGGAMTSLRLLLVQQRVT